MGEKFDEVCRNIRACLNSSQRQSTLSELSRDYREVLGEPIPFKSLGYSSLESLVHAVPQLKVTKNNGELYIDVRPDEKTAHIATLVREQKNSKKKPKRRNYGTSLYRPKPSPRRSYDVPVTVPKRRPPPPKISDTHPVRRPEYEKPRPKMTRSPPITISSESDSNESPRYDTRYFNSKMNENYSDSDEELICQMAELQVTLGKEPRRQVSVGKNADRKNGHPITLSNEDDKGYSSMNEITIMNEPLRTDCNEMGDRNNNKRNLTRGPASFLAAGRAMQEPNIQQIAKQSSSNQTFIPPSPRQDFVYERQPFHMLNQPYKPTPNAIMNPINSKAAPAFAPAPASASAMVGSKMSDPNMFKSGPSMQPNLNDSPWCRKLYEFTVRHNLQAPVYKNFTKFCPKLKVASYMCKVKIGNSLSFTSCPSENRLVTEAQELVAKIAFNELSRRYENSDSSTFPITEDENLIIKRVADIVNPHHTGLKCESIETKYKILYQEILPLHWLEIVKNRSLLSVEELVSGLAVYPVEGINIHADVSKLPPLVLPTLDVWNIFVTCCVSTNCIYFRIIHEEYNGKYAAMDEKMYELYNMKKDELKYVDIVKEGSYYAAYLDKSWFRVKALTGINNGCVRVSLIDHGDVDEVRKEHLFPLDERFTSIPPQKVHCSLSGLDEYSKESYVTKMVYDLICGKTFVAQVDGRNPNLQLTLVDTSTEIDINVNELILEKITKELSLPKIPPKDNVADAYLVSVKEDGLAFVQILSESFKLLKSFLAEASHELASSQKNYCVKSTNELVGNRIFLAKYLLDGQWYRVLIHSVTNENEIEVFFVDYGNLDLVKLKDIADVKHFNEALAIIPHQAVQVRLLKPTSELFTENVLQFLMDLSLSKDTGEPTNYLLKTIKEGGVPDVELFFRMPDTNELVKLNVILASYFPDYRTPDHVENKISSRIMERVCPIPNFDVPIKEQFNVFVTMVSSPSNFIVQPQDCRQKLIDLMSDMNDFYSKEQPLVDVENIEEEEFYAVKTDNGKWFRGVVVKVMRESGSISIKLMDYGNIVSISSSNLAHLLPCFRELPKQAIKADLAGVSPLHCDWSVEDSLRFKNLVSQKTLVSIVVDEQKSGKVSLILYDTSADQEVDIGSVLVEERRAKDITIEN